MYIQREREREREREEAAQDYLRISRIRLPLQKINLANGRADRPHLFRAFSVLEGFQVMFLSVNRNHIPGTFHHKEHEDPKRSTHLLHVCAAGFLQFPTRAQCDKRATWRPLIYHITLPGYCF